MEPYKSAAAPGPGQWVMGSPALYQGPHPAGAGSTAVPVGYVPSAKHYLDPNPYVQYSGTPSAANNGNPYVQVAAVPATKGKGSKDVVIKLLERCGRRMEEGAKKATATTGNVWHHLKTSPSVCDAAIARLTHGTKVLAEGGSDKIFHQTFGTLPGEQLRKVFACYISTSSGPVIGTLYVSTRRLGFCSDNPICHHNAQGQQEWVYYKVVVQLDQLRAVNPSASVKNPSEKYIQIVTVDGHEFWFMGFVSYDKALKALIESVHHHHV